MTKDTVEAAIKEAERFLERAKAIVWHEWQSGGNTFTSANYTHQTAAARRASMDLTRALADMRKY